MPTPNKKHSAIALLVSKFPHQIKHPELIGLRFKEGTTVAIVIKDASGGQFSVGLKFNRLDEERILFFEETAHQSWLPALASPGCIVSLDLDNDDVNLYLLVDRWRTDLMVPFAVLAGFLEEFDDSDVDEERFAGSAEQ